MCQAVGGGVKLRIGDMICRLVNDSIGSIVSIFITVANGTATDIDGHMAMGHTRCIRNIHITIAYAHLINGLLFAVRYKLAIFLCLV